MSYYYSSLDRRCKSVIGAVARGQDVTFRLYDRNPNVDPNGDAEDNNMHTKTNGNPNGDSCVFVLYRDGEGSTEYPMQREADGWAITLRVNVVGLYFYFFRLNGAYFGCSALRRGDFENAKTANAPLRNWQLTVYDEHFSTPDWFKGGVMYQIFPDRFAKSGDLPIADYKTLRVDWGGTPSFRKNQFGKVLNNDFFGGNFQGVLEKLDYIQELGVTVIYFNPVFEAYSNHRYDTGDYMKIDPLLGTEETFRLLVREAEKRGIRVILDGVFNHTGDDSRYFNKYGRYQSVGAYQSLQSPYADWYHFHQYPASYDSWWGIETLPAVNEQSQSYREFIFGENGVLRHWLKAGIGGWRLDVADELPPFFLKELRKSVKAEKSDAVIIGEVWEDASNKIAYDMRREYFQGFELDSVMNYPLKNAIIDFILYGNLSALRETIFMLLDHYPKPALDCLMNILGTHDTPRILTVFGGKVCADKEEMARTFLTDEEKERAKRKLKMAALLEFTLPGVPCVYYGDEIGMQGYLDPFCRGCFRWDEIDEELHSFYGTLGKIRKQYPNAFCEGEFREVFAEERCFGFSRNDEVFIFVNNSPREYRVQFAGDFTELLSGLEICGGHLTLGGYQYGIYVRHK